VTVRKFFALAVAGGLGLTPLGWTQEPTRLDANLGHTLPARPAVTPNQKMANLIAEHLSQSGQLRGYTIDLSYQDGTVELSGHVADQPQREEAVRIVQGVPGVERVRNNLMVADTIQQTQSPLPPVPDAPALPEKPPERLPTADARPVEPMPIFQAPAPSPYDTANPRMPPYAWPTYAPFNNYSRVATPLLYPYNAWPYIGPQYPFPKIPLGWRSVKLEWQDGHWWFG
jgi:hypothetical protein